LKRIFLILYDIDDSKMILLIDNTPDARSKNYYYHLVDFLKTHVTSFKIISKMADFNDVRERDVKGIILSGSPMRIGMSIHPNKLRVAITSFTRFPNVPIYGICFGFQLMNVVYGGTVKPFGREVCEVHKVGRCDVQFCFNDMIDEVAPGFTVEGVANIDRRKVICHIRNRHLKRVGTLFHPEADDDACHYLRNFLVNMCNVKLKEKSSN
jgi:anthranilate/para-aminobenzoate synthase component II